MTRLVHVCPDDDLMQHETDGAECSCGPDVSQRELPDGTSCCVAVHHALDHRLRYDDDA